MYRTCTALALLSAAQISTLAAVPLYLDQQEKTIKSDAHVVDQHASPTTYQQSESAVVALDGKTPATITQKNQSAADVSDDASKPTSSMGSRLMRVATNQMVFVDAQAGVSRVNQQFLPATTISAGYFFTPRIALETAYTRVITPSVLYLRSPELNSDYFSAGFRGFVLDNRIYMSTGAARSRYVDQVYTVAYRPYAIMGYQHAIAGNVWLNCQISHAFFAQPVSKLEVGVRWSNQ